MNGIIFELITKKTEERSYEKTLYNFVLDFICDWIICSKSKY